MRRIIHAISILSLAAAGLILAHHLAQSAHRNSQADRILAAPSAIERFLQSRPAQSDQNDRLPPLVAQAQAWALYLNPPRAPVTSASAPKSPAALALPVTPGRSATPVTQIRPPASSPRFELHGISYYRQKPEQSMALVLEPGGNRRWVHPGEQLGHLTIEQIDCNSVVCRDGAQTQVMALAPSEALTQYARSVGPGPQVPNVALGGPSQLTRNATGVPGKDTESSAAPKQAQNETKGPEVPPPAPGMRQMPLSRVAALLGQSS